MSKADTTNKPNKTQFIGVYSGPPFVIKLRGLNMRLINVFSFYELGTTLGKLRAVGWVPRKEAFELLADAERQLGKLINLGKEFFQPLGLAASAIEVDIDEAAKHLGETGHVGQDCERLLKQSLDQFEHAFANQRYYLRVFGVEQLRAYLMPILVDGADQAFHPDAVRALTDDILKEIREAGRSLAFELPTASGVHIMRAFEKVLRRFYKLATGEEPGHTDIKTLLDKMKRQASADDKTLAVLDQIRNLHRNPLAHEVFLDTNEAVELFDIAKSAITAMVLDPKVKFFT